MTGKPRRSRAKERQRVRLYAMIGAMAIVLTLAGVAYMAYSLAPRVLMDYYVQLTITDIRVRQNATIPAEVGVSPVYWYYHVLDRFGISGKAPLHTHDTSGRIHVESNVIVILTLGDFFRIWGKELTANCVVSYCTDLENGVPPPWMDVGPMGGEKTEMCVDPSYPMRDGYVITILLGGGPPGTLECVERGGF